ncbi:MAG: pirin family protein [Prevotella sp.]|nr:pirin family protein [Prevotella sp.]
MKIRKVIEKVQGVRATDGAGVSLVRVLGHDNVYNFDPFLMLDSFDSEDPRDYQAGFPTHPHRGIETVSYIAKGSMTHGDHLGTRQTISNGEAQWLTAGSGAFHSELPAGDSLLGLQFWLNMPKNAKMKAAPAYHGITRDEIQEFPFKGGMLRLITGEYEGHRGWQGKYLPLDYYDIHLDAHASITLKVKEENTVMLFTLVGDVVSGGSSVPEKTAARLGEGDSVTIEAGKDGAEVMLMSAPPTGEPIAWYGPIVMNTQSELRTALRELNDGTFIKQKIEYSDI